MPWNSKYWSFTAFWPCEEGGRQIYIKKEYWEIEKIAQDKYKILIDDRRNQAKSNSILDAHRMIKTQNVVN